MNQQFSRTERIIGEEALNKLKNSKVCVFGVGGVGSYVTEGLARSGVGHLRIVDHDVVDVTNINRQIIATHNTIGMSKVDVMKKRILSINPKAKVEAVKQLYNIENAENFFETRFDYIVDAIDMVTSKLDLIERCKQKDIPIISSMGTGNKLNPTMLEVADIYETSICPLAKVMRKELKKRNVNSLKVVYSKEQPLKPINSSNEPNFDYRTPGSTSFVPPVAGFIIVSEIVKDIISK